MSIRLGFCCVLLFSVLVSSWAWAGKYNPTLNVGDAAPSFQDLPGVDDRSHGLAEFNATPIVVVAFTCNTCPTAVDYEDRVMALVKKYSAGDKVKFVAINANQVADDLLPKMKERAEERKFNYLYLHDDTQQVAKAYGAQFTPEFFVLNQDRKIVYMGALDDNTAGDKVAHKYLEDALDATLAGQKPELTETVGRGCLIRFTRQRDKKK